MDRLTYRLEDQWGNPTDSIILKPYMRYDDEKVKKTLLNRLASYEDTGLTPQEIEQMKARMPLHQWSGESPEKMSIFGVPVSKIMEWAKTEKNSIRDLNDIANSVEEKMMYMCGCRNCIEKVKMIIKGEVKPIENQCKYCKLECDARST